MKYALNTDIQEVHAQLQCYYEAVARKPALIAQEIQQVFHQKLELGLFDQPPERLDAMKTLTVARKIEQFQFIVVLVDYNPNSKLFDVAGLRSLPFASQVRLLHTGFALWQQSFQAL
ncbi:MAG: hypothetical protein RLZZ387_565 [Chloroflexota bacterium]